MFINLLCIKIREVLFDNFYDKKYNKKYFYLGGNIMFNLDDYYIGLIFADPNTYNPIKAARYLGDINFDPFDEVPLIQKFFLGVTVLLKKNQDGFNVIEYERYDNDLKLRLNEVNRNGIILRYVKPLKEVYGEDYKIYNAEDLVNVPGLIEEAITTGTYYVVYREVAKKYEVRIMDDELSCLVRRDFFEEASQNIYAKNKK